MDYKDKYIKYKTKYLKLKNINNMIGGNKISNIDILHQPIKTLYHGSPYLLEELIPKKPRGSDDFNSQIGVYLSSNKIESQLYSLARDKERINKGWGIKNGFLYLRKDRWLKKNNNSDKPLYMLNDVGYLYIVNNNNYSQNPHNLNEYISKKSIKIDKIKVIYYDDIKKYIKYVSKEEMNNVFL